MTSERQIRAMKPTKVLLLLFLLYSQANSQGILLPGSASYYRSSTQWGKPHNAPRIEEPPTYYEQHREQPSTLLTEGQHSVDAEDKQKYYSRPTPNQHYEVREYNEGGDRNNEGFIASEPYNTSGEEQLQGTSPYPGFSHFQQTQHKTEGSEVDVLQEEEEVTDPNTDFEEFEGFGRDDGSEYDGGDFVETNPSYIHHGYEDESSRVHYNKEPLTTTFYNNNNNFNRNNHDEPSTRPPVRFNPYGGYQVYGREEEDSRAAYGDYARHSLQPPSTTLHQQGSYPQMESRHGPPPKRPWTTSTP